MGYVYRFGGVSSVHIGIRRMGRQKPCNRHGRGVSGAMGMVSDTIKTGKAVQKISVRLFYSTCSHISANKLLYPEALASQAVDKFTEYLSIS